MPRPVPPFFWMLIVLLVATLCACEVPPVRKGEIKVAREVPPGTNAKPIQFRRILVKLPLGEAIGRLHYGWGCFPGAPIIWRGGRLNLTAEELTETFRSELKKANYPVVGDPYALFEDPTALRAEILVAGLVEKIETTACFPFSGSPTANIGYTNSAKGGAFMRVTWQVYSLRDEKVVHSVATEGSFHTDELIPGGVPRFLLNAFSANIRNLLSDPGFHGLVVQTEKP